MTCSKIKEHTKLVKLQLSNQDFFLLWETLDLAFERLLQLVGNLFGKEDIKISLPWWQQRCISLVNFRDKRCYISPSFSLKAIVLRMLSVITLEQHQFCVKPRRWQFAFSFFPSKQYLTFLFSYNRCLKRRSNVSTASFYPQYKIIRNWCFTNTRKSCLTETSFSPFEKRTSWRRISLDDSDAQISDVFWTAAVHNSSTLAKLPFSSTVIKKPRSLSLQKGSCLQISDILGAHFLDFLCSAKASMIEITICDTILRKGQKTYQEQH